MGNPVAGAASSLLSVASTGATTTSLAAGVTLNDFTTLFESLSYSYLASPDSRIFIHPTFAWYLLNLRDGSNRSYFSWDAQQGLESILCVKVALNNALPAYTGAANQVIAIAGDARKALTYQDAATSVHTLVERFY